VPSDCPGAVLAMIQPASRQARNRRTTRPIERASRWWAAGDTHLFRDSTCKPGSSRSTPALLVGRSIYGVYSKVLIFRALDPRSEFKGNPASETFRNLWREFFDSETRQLNSAAIRQEFSRLWEAGKSVPDSPVTDGQAAEREVRTEAERLERQPLEDLLARYAEQQDEPQKRKNSGRPPTGVVRRRVYDRDPLVFAIAVKRANRKCEAAGCQYVAFHDAQGTPYVGCTTSCRWRRGDRT
jgi:hypothetical protein